MVHPNTPPLEELIAIRDKFAGMESMSTEQQKKLAAIEFQIKSVQKEQKEQ